MRAVKKLIRQHRWIFISLLILTASGFVLHFYGKSIVKNLVQRYVQQETAGGYRLTYDGLSFNLLDRSLTLEEVALTPDSTDSTRVNKTQYHIKVRQMKVNLKDIIELYTKKKFHIEGIEVDNPEITLSRADQKEKIALDVADFYLLISDYIEVLQIDYLRLSSGTFIYANTGEEFRNIDFSLKSFKLDSIRDSTNIFFSDEIELKLEKQSFILPDSLHKLSFSELRLSTKDSLLSLKKVRVRPLAESDTDSTASYTINIPSLELVGIDYRKAYHNGFLVLDSLKLYKPKIDLTPREQKSSSNVKQILSGLFKSYAIKTFLLVDADISYHRLSYDMKTLINANFAGVTLDSGAVEPADWFETAEVSVENYHYSDSIWQITLDSVSASSQKQHVALFNMKARQCFPDDTASFSLEVLTVDKVRLEKLTENKGLAATQIKLLRPEVAGLNGKSQKKKKLSPQELQKAIAPFVSYIATDSLIIIDGSFKLNQINIRDFNFNAQSFRLDTAVQNWSGIARQEKASMTFSTRYDSVEIEGVLAYREKNQQLQLLSPVVRHMKNDSLQAKAKDITFFGLTLDDLISSDIPALDSVYITAPSIKWELQTAKNDTTRLPIDLGKIRVINGTIDLRVNGKRIASDSTNITATYTGDSLTLQTLFLEKLKANDRVAVDKVSFDQASCDLQLQNVAFTEKNMSATSPAVTATNWQPADLIYKNKLMADEVIVSTPTVDGHFEKRQGSSPKFKWPIALDVSEVAINHGKIRIFNVKDGDTTSIQSSINLKLTAVNDEFDLYSNNYLLYSENVEIQLYEALVKNAKHLIRLDSFAFDHQKESLSLYNLKFINEAKTGQVEIDQTTLQSLDLPQLIDNNRLVATSLALEGTQFNWKETDSAKKVALPFAKVSLGEIRSEELNAQLNFIDVPDPLNLKITELFIQKVDADSTSSLANLLQTVDQFSFEGQDFSHSLEKGHYLLNVEQYGYSHKDRHAYFDNVKLDPQLDRLAYSSTLEFQKDWFDVFVSSITMEGLQAEAALTDKHYKLEKLVLDGVEADIFRDKHVLFDSTQRRQLPQGQLKSLGMVFNIDSLLLKGNITYSERPGTTNRIAGIDFTNLDGAIINMASRDSLYELPMYLHAKGKILGSGNFAANVTFDMTKPKHPFRFSGKVGPMDLKTMNELLFPIANIKVKSGESQEASFIFDGDDDVASGTIDFRYKKLKISILNSKTHDRQGFTQNLKTFFANSFVIHKSNPRLFNFREGVIFYKRDKKRAVFNFWSKAILSGAVSSVGINRSQRSFLKYKREQKKSEKDDDG